MRFQSAFIAVVVLAASIVFAKDDLDESNAIEEIVFLGGKVTRDETLPGRPVIEVDMTGRGSRKFNDKYFQLLKEFTSLKSLTLIRCEQMTDQGLKELKEFKHLTTLNLLGSSISDAGLVELSEFTNLTTLNLAATKITDDGLKELKRLKSLTTLNLASTQITDTGLKQISELRLLTSLFLSSGRITDIGIRELDVYREPGDTALSWFDGISKAGRELKTVLS